MPILSWSKINAALCRLHVLLRGTCDEYYTILIKTRKLVCVKPRASEARGVVVDIWLCVGKLVGNWA